MLAEILIEKDLPVMASVHLKKALGYGPGPKARLKAIELLDDVFDEIPYKLPLAQMVPVAELINSSNGEELSELICRYHFKSDNFNEFNKLCKNLIDDDERFKLMQLFSEMEKGFSPEKAQKLSKFSDDASPEVSQKALLFLARNAYKEAKFELASESYDKIRSPGYAFLDSVEENLWARYQAGEEEKALGLSLMLMSPFFDPYFIPTAYLVYSKIMAGKCRFENAISSLDRMKSKYSSLYKRSQSIEKEFKSNIYKKLLRTKTKKDLSVYNYLMSKSEIAMLTKHLINLELEMKSFSNLPLGKAEIKKLLSESVNEFSSLKIRVDNITQSEIKDFAFKIRNSLKNQHLLEAEIYGDIATLNTPGASLEKRKVKASLKQIKWWPFNGEYWQDEILSMRYKAKDRCPK